MTKEDAIIEIKSIVDNELSLEFDGALTLLDKLEEVAYVDGVDIGIQTRILQAVALLNEADELMSEISDLIEDEVY